MSAPAIAIRRARRQDAAEAWELVRATGVLDVNSPYCYLLAFEELADSCVVARGEDGELLGFVLGLRPPRRPDTLFVWQVAVSEAARGRGLGRRLLHAAALGPELPPSRHLEATVTPSNAPSRALFHSFARAHGVPCDVSPHFAAGDFPGADHEPEELFRIGPLPAPRGAEESA